MKLDNSIKLGDPIPLFHGNYEPIFIVGMNGSGTTMLLDSLGKHPNIFAYPRETRIIPNLIDNIDRFGDLEIDENFLCLWHSVLTIPAFRGKKYNSPKPPLPSNWRDFPRKLSAVLDAVFRSFAIKQGKSRWCEKTPHHLQHLLNLHTIFPHAKFIHIIRDGRDCAASFHRRWRRRPELTIYRWKKVIQEGKKQAEEINEHYLELKYEEITSKPRVWMNNICDHLKLPFDENLLLSSKRQSRDRNEEKRIEKNPYNWNQYFEESAVKRLEKIAGGYLQDLGYKTQSCAGNEDPTNINLLFWRWSDRIYEFSAKLSNKPPSAFISSIYWYLNRIIIAIKQSSSNRY